MQNIDDCWNPGFDGVESGEFYDTTLLESIFGSETATPSGEATPTPNRQVTLRRAVEQPSHASEPVGLLYSLLGCDAVLLPIPRGVKGPRTKNWSQITWQETQGERYQKRLREGNIGVLLGKAGNGLCTIDCDLDDILDKFLALNQILRNTLITKGKRGGNVWVKMTGGFSGTKRFEQIGEWRSDGAQTVIWGIHPEGMAYRFLNEAKPIEIAFSEIVWPKGFDFSEVTNSPPHPAHYSSVSTVTESVSCVPVSPESVSLYHNTSEVPPPSPNLIAERIRLDATLDARKKEWLTNPDNAPLRDLYEVHVDRYFRPNQGQRNQFIAEAAPRLYYAVSPEIALSLLMAFYDINQPVFNDPRRQHEHESRAMLTSLEKTFLEKLTPFEREIYSTLSEEPQPAFRILRDLALREDKGASRGTFFMSASEFARRLGLGHPMVADRLLKNFIGYGIIKVLVLGDQFQSGKKAMATLYAWKIAESLLQPLEPVSTTHGESINLFQTRD